jgi:hypothetical protein
MTVCVAAMGGNALLGASDRMLTVGEIVEVESPESKSQQIAPKIVAMQAGDTAFQREILLALKKRIPDGERTVLEMAELYRSCYNDAVQVRAAQEVLVPVGMTWAMFLENQHSLHADFLSDLTSQLRRYEPPGAETLIVGHDETGYHIYQLVGRRLDCRDAVGFAAVGIGAWHSLSQFMQWGHGTSATFTDTAYLTYAAKRRGQIAPGVGQATDMFMIGASPIALTKFQAPMMDRLEVIYAKAIAHEAAGTDYAREYTKKWFQEMGEENRRREEAKQREVDAKKKES